MPVIPEPRPVIPAKAGIPVCRLPAVFLRCRVFCHHAGSASTGELIIERPLVYNPEPFGYSKFGSFCRRRKMSSFAEVFWIPAFAGMTGWG